MKIKALKWRTKVEHNHIQFSSDMKYFNQACVNLVLCYISKIDFHSGAFNNTDNVWTLVNVKDTANENKFPGLGVIKIFTPWRASM